MSNCNLTTAYTENGDLFEISRYFVARFWARSTFIDKIMASLPNSRTGYNGKVVKRI